MEKTKKINFFRRIKMAIFDLEDYIKFVTEKTSKAFWYMILYSLIFAILMTVANGIYVFSKYNSVSNFIDSVLPDFKYEDQELVIEDVGKDERKREIVSVVKQYEPEIKSTLGDSTYSKNELIDEVKKNEGSVISAFCFALIVNYFWEILFWWIIVAILTAFIGSLVLHFSRIRMKYLKLFALSIYASTLSVLIFAIYMTINILFGITIDLFEYLDVLIAYIYITSVIYMIKSDLITQQMELIRIATMKVRDKNFEQDKEVDEKQPEKPEKKPEEKPEIETDDKKEKDELDDEPDGSEI